MSTNHFQYRLLINCVILALFVPLSNTVIHAANMDKDPYLIYNGTNTEMEVLWQLDATQSCTLEWGTTTSYSDGSVPTTEYGTDHQHRYTITGLTPGVKNYYRVTYGGSNRTGNFNAAPADSATNLKMFAFGDTRSQPGRMDDVAEQMIATYTTDPAYQTICLLTGDWSQSNSESSWTNEYFSSSATNAIEFRAKVPINGCRGNHESYGNVYDKYYPYPYVGGFYWSFDYGPVHVAIVDQYTPYSTGTPQYNWLVNDLATSTKPWKIVMFHEPAWSAGGNGNDTGAQIHLQPVFKQYNVQLIIAGHNHFYSRAVVNGVQHITSGGGGAPLYNGSISGPVVAFTKTYHHCEIDIQGNDLYFNAIKSDGSVIDTFSLVGSGADYDPPEPDPMTFSSVPAATGDSSIAMTATEATDSFSVQYYFACTAGGGNNSDWQFDRTYEDASLEPSTEYIYTVTARDMSLNQNETTPSTPPASATTDSLDTASPIPNPMTWSSTPNDTSTSTISMTATTATDSSGVEYYFECTAGGGHDSGWQDSRTYEDSGLMYNTQYTYRVKARDKSSDPKETGYSDTASVTTANDAALWTSKAIYALGEDIVVNFANASGDYDDWIGLYVDSGQNDDYITYQHLGTTSGSRTFSGLAGEGPYDLRLFFHNSYNLEALFGFTVAPPDAIPPSPDPMTFATPPSSAGDTSISMTATTATDDNPVEYYFKNITIPGHDSGWPGSSSYTDTALTTGQVYGYKVICRDLSANYNMTDFSAPEFSMAGSPGGTVTVPDIAGYDPNTAEKVIIASGLTVGAWDSAHSEVFAIGRISSQDPPGGTTADSGDPVDFTVSLGLLADHDDDDMVGLSDLVIVVSAWLDTTNLTNFAEVSSQWLDIVVVPFAYWPFDSDALDDSLNGWHGTLNGDASFTTDPNRGHCLLLDGDGDYMNVGFILNPADGPFSLCAWVKNGTDKDNIMCQTNGTGTARIWLHTNASGYLATQVRTSGGGGLFSAYSGHTDGNWHHVAMVYDGNRRYLYADGDLVASDPSDLPESLEACDGDLYVGASQALSADAFWDGLMDDVRIYNKAMSSSEIFALYNSELLP